MSHNTKYFAAFIMLLVAVGIVYTGWNITLNVWLASALGGALGFLIGGPIGSAIGIFGGALVANVAVKVFAVILAAWTLILAAIVLAVESDSVKWAIALWIFSTLFIITLVLPDPVPFIDEILLGLGSFVTGTKVIAGSDKKPMGAF